MRETWNEKQLCGQPRIGGGCVERRDVYINGALQGITLWLSPTSGCASEKRASSFSTRLALRFHETEDYTIYPAPIITMTKNRFIIFTKEKVLLV